MRALACAALVAALALPSGAQTRSLLADGTDTAFPSGFGGAYSLTDHHGRTRTEADPDGNLQLVFFGYATCESICTVALPILSDVAAALTAQGVGVTPVVVTIDPGVDTVDAMGPALATQAPGLLGLTGTEAELAAVRDLFHVEKTPLFEDPTGRTIYAHGAHIFVMDAEGGFLTLLPPVLPPERMVEIVRGYAEAS